MYGMVWYSDIIFIHPNPSNNGLFSMVSCQRGLVHDFPTMDNDDDDVEGDGSLDYHDDNVKGEGSSREFFRQMTSH